MMEKLPMEAVKKRLRMNGVANANYLSVNNVLKKYKEVYGKDVIAVLGNGKEAIYRPDK